MLFIPYKLDVELFRIPFITLFIILVCSFIFKLQWDSWHQYQSSVDYYCENSLSSSVKQIIDKVNHKNLSCAQFWQSIQQSEYPEMSIKSLAYGSEWLKSLKGESHQAEWYYQELLKEYQYFQQSVSSDLTTKIQYDPHSFNIINMISSSFSHASISHLVGNLFFFFIFAAGVEILIGSVYLLAVIFVMTLTTGLAYSMSVFGASDALPTVGLSGVVMGMLAILAVLVPNANFRCLFWFLVIFKRFTVPVFVLAIWYVGWDYYDMTQLRDSNINYVAHISGAITGAIIGVFFKWYKLPINFLQKRRV